MSIKSEKAKEYINEYEQDGFTYMSDSFKAIELAESDAEHRCRERAVRALNVILGEISIDVMQGKFKLGIDYREKFLKHYDNDSKD